MSLKRQDLKHVWLQAAILSRVADREKMESKDISIQDWQEAL